MKYERIQLHRPVKVGHLSDTLDVKKQKEICVGKGGTSLE